MFPENKILLIGSIIGGIILVLFLSSLFLFQGGLPSLNDNHSSSSGILVLELISENDQRVIDNKYFNVTASELSICQSLNTGVSEIVVNGTNSIMISLDRDQAECTKSFFGSKRAENQDFRVFRFNDKYIAFAFLSA